MPLRNLVQVFALLMALLPAIAGAESWTQGIARLGSLARNSDNEVSDFFFQVAEKGRAPTEQWVGFSEGDASNVVPNFPEAGRYIKKFAHKPLERVIGCVIHTHMKSAYKGYQKMSPEELGWRYAQGLEALEENGHISMPPGLGDISVDLEISRLLGDVGVQGRITGGLAVVDSLGIWYWGLFRGKRDQQDYLKSMGISQAALEAKIKKAEDLNVARTPFMIAASRAKVEGEKVTSMPLYRELLLAYAAKEIKLRFVPFSLLALEAPCQSYP